MPSRVQLPPFFDAASSPACNCVWAAGARLGESPVWDAAQQRLLFVDIKQPAILSWGRDGARHAYPMPGEIGCIVMRQGGGLVAALQAGLAFVTLAPSLKVELFSVIDTDRPGNRPNEGKCDAAGRLWVASMDNAEREASGRLWRISTEREAVCMGQGHVVGNGMGWSPDGTRMYFTDSVRRTIFSYRFDAATGSLGERRCFAVVAADAGYPDGLTVDAEGCIWSAHWDGWRITRYRPDGRVDRVMRLPVPRPTSLTFGGERYDRLFVTSAAIGLDADSLAQAPLSGGLFELDAGVCGLPEPGFAG